MTLAHKLGANVDETGLENLWEAISCPFLGKTAHSALLQHIKELTVAAESRATWKASPYAKAVRFEDDGTLDSVRGYLSTITAECESRSSPGREVIVPSLNQSSEHDEISRFATSASPLAQQARGDIWESTRGFFTTGSFSKTTAGQLPNPLYFSNDGLLIPENPLMGFHLATSYTPLTELSPLRPDLTDDPDMHRSLQSAKVQFNEWTHALCEQLGSRLSLSLVAADPLAYCDAVQRLASGEEDGGSYRMQNSTETLRLNPNSVTRFDAIEASNVTGNRIRTLLTLASAAPLLKDADWSTIYTEFNIRMGDMRENPLEDLLYAETHTVSLLLGVGAAEIATNSSSTSIVDDVLLGVEDGVELGNQTSPIYYRLSWKHIHSLSGEPSPTPLSISAEQLVDLLIELDHKIYEVEERPTEGLRTRSASPFYRLGLLVPLIKAASRHVQFPVAEACVKFLDGVNKDPKRAGISEELHDLALQMHLRGLYSASYLADPVSPDSRETKAASVPTVAAVSAIVKDSSELESFFALDQYPNQTVSFEARVVHSKGKVETFRDLQLMSANSVEVTGPPNLSGFQERGLNINVSRDGSNKKLIVLSFWVPIALLVNEDVEFQLIALPYPVVEGVYGLTLCRGKLVDELASSDPQFVLTPAMPSSERSSIKCSPDPPVKGVAYDLQTPGRPEDGQSAVTIQFSAKEKTTTMVARQNLRSEQARKLLADKVPIAIKQSGPFSLNVVFITDADAVIYTLHYPTPVTTVGIKSRVARTTGYIEVIAPFATHEDNVELSNAMFPSLLTSKGVSVPLNLPQVNLDSLPALDLSNEAAIKWIITLTSFQFSSKERVDRANADEKTGMTQSSRINFKESLFSMFMAATGLQGGQTGLFVLNQPGGEGVHMIILVSAVRLDCAANSVVLDAAVIPLTSDMIKDPEIEDFLLLLRTLEICSLDVDEEELKVWKTVLPALSERCRTWEHVPSCEYKKAGATAPLGLKLGDPVLCSCGKGQIPEAFLGLPGWKEAASKHAVRVGISPAFACPLVERTVDFAAVMPREKEVMRCKACGKKESDLEEGEKLRRCTRCRGALYCSGTCQKKDWKKHRFECKEDEEQD